MRKQISILIIDDKNNPQASFEIEFQTEQTVDSTIKKFLTECVNTGGLLTTKYLTFPMSVGGIDIQQSKQYNVYP